MSGNRFYVYEHWRPDLDLCFWVGKGTGDRARRFKRNAAYNSVVAGLNIIGMCVEIRMVASAMTEMQALRAEEARIAFWRSVGVALTNRTIGGSGNRGMFVTDETREKIRLANLGRKHSAETRAKMSAAHQARCLAGIGVKGRPAGFTHSADTIAKIRAANAGKPVSAEKREVLRLANLGKKHSDSTREKMSRQRIGNKNGCGGKGLKRSEETKRRMSVAQRGHQVSDETRAKLSTAAKTAHARLRENTP